uniref:NADH-ubiquinone oxidoreductase chain 3 n=1 Tax=Aesalus sp. JL-2019 TaxID=2565995 RepID=A0A7L4VDZ7_9SCAR|nr:NADH dehydrogenase subunit 3 [Aesalus sp. JL-2019]
MMMVNYISYMILVITLLMIIISTMISKKSMMDREKSSPFECGFDPKSSPRLPFSLQFFLIAIIFLIFDVEITLLMPLIITMKISNLINYSIILSFFLMILLVGLYYEWAQGALNWAY